MPAQPLGLHDLVSLPALEPAGFVYDVPYPIRDQVVGVAHRTASQNGRRVDRGGERRPLQQTRSATRLDPAIEDLARGLVEHQLSPEALQRALRAELLVQLQAQRDLPPQVEGAAGDRLLVRNRIVRLQQQRDRQLRGRDARASEVLAVQGDEILIAKPVRTLASQQSVESLLAYVISKRVIRTEEIALRLSTT